MALPNNAAADVDSTVMSNLQAARGQLPAAIFQAALGYNDSFDALTEIFEVYGLWTGVVMSVWAE